MDPESHFLSMMDAVNLPYHNRRHVETAMRFSKHFLGIVDEEAMKDIRIALAAHDIGYLWKYGRNEKLAARYAAKALSIMGYDNNISWLILATIPDREPATVEERIMKECDIAYVSSSRYFFDAEMLRMELSAMGEWIPRHEWMKMQEEFLGGVRFMVDVLEKGRKRNLEAVKSKLRGNRER